MSLIIKTYFLTLTAIAQKDELVERCKAGDRLAFKELYTCYSKAMFNTCFRLLEDITEAEDVLQDSFIEAFRNIKAFEYRTTFGGWLKQICINRSINQLKKRKVILVDIDNTSVHNHTEAAVIDEAEIQFKVESVKKAIQQLPDGYRTVLNLYLLEGYDHQEIAEILNVAESTTRSQYIRAKQKLVQILNTAYEQAGKIY